MKKKCVPRLTRTKCSLQRWCYFFVRFICVGDIADGDIFKAFFKPLFINLNHKPPRRMRIVSPHGHHHGTLGEASCWELGHFSNRFLIERQKLGVEVSIYAEK